GLAYFAVYTPLNGKIEETKRKLGQEQRLETLFQDVELLRAQMEFFEHRLVKNSDANEWIEYVLNGVRALPVHLTNLDLKDERKIGLYRAVGLRLEVSGEMKDLDALLLWLETNERLFRVDVMRLDTDRKQETRRVMQLELLGLKG
ncbi:MAG: hypothetical protein ACC628_24495, partial [Pirellulaceae bacterium]